MEYKENNHVAGCVCVVCEDNHAFIRRQYESAIPKEDWGIHESHCCIIHGCKYGYEQCPVVIGRVEQDYPCETCWGEGVDNLEDIRRLKSGSIELLEKDFKKLLEVVSKEIGLEEIVTKLTCGINKINRKRF